MTTRGARGLVAILAVGVIGACLASPAIAQRGQMSTLTGVVRDASGAVVPGVALEAASRQLIGGATTTTTNDQGLYRFFELAPGEYTIQAMLAGFKTMTRRGVVLVPGGTVTIDWTLEVATTAELVEVHGAAPVVDVRSSSAPNRLTSTLLQQLPSTRTVAGLVNLTPGTVADVPLGATASSIAVTFDGTPASRPSGGEPLVSPVFHSLDEVQVVATGAGADHNDFTGVAANLVLRSGGNSLRGLGEYRGRRPNWVGNNRGTLPANLQQQFRPQELLVDWDAAGSVGGPVMRDRLWYFAAAQAMVFDQRPAGWMNVPKRDGEPVSSLADRRGLGKLTARLSPGVRVEGFYQKNRVQHDAFNAGPFVADEALGRVDDRLHMWNVRALWTPTDRTVFTVINGGYRQHYYEGPTPPASAAGPPPRYDQVTFVESGGYVWFTDSRLRPITTSARVTHVVDGGVGLGHEVSAGVEVERSSSNESWGYPGGMSFTDAAGVPQTVDILPATHVRPRRQRTSFFAQDRWQLSDRLTLEPGVRLVLNRGKAIDRGTVYSTTPLSPRVGIAWDVARDHRTVVRAHYGRYHDTLLDNAYSFMDPLGSPVYTFAVVTGPNTYDTVSTSGGPTNQAIDSGLTQSFVDAYLVGVERELFADFSLRAQYLHRAFENHVAFIDEGSVYVPVPRVDPGRDGRLNTADDGGTITVFDRQNVTAAPRRLTNVDEAFRRYQALQLIGTKRYSRNWELQASYTWSRARGNVNNIWGTNAASNGLGPNGQFADPNRLINAEGTPSHDYPHQATVLGVVRLPWWGGFNAGSVVRYYSGRPYGRTARFTGLRQGAVTVRVEPIGTYRLPATSEWDLRLEKTVHLGARGRLGLSAEVLNVANQGTSRFVSEGSGASFGIPGQWTVPRSLRVGGRVTF